MDKVSSSRKKELAQPDEVEVFLNKVLRYAMTYKTQLISAIGVLLFSVIVVSGMSYNSDRNEGRASAALDSASGKYAEVLKEKGAVEAYDATKESYGTLFSEYGSTSAGKLAGIKFANISYDAGKYDKAAELFQSAIGEFGKDHPFKTLLLSGLAYSFAGKEDYESAARYFNEIVSGTSNMMKDDALFNLGLMYEKMGDREKSNAAFKKLTVDHSNSIYVKVAEEKITG